MNKAKDKGYTIIRIIQEDIWRAKNNWESKTKKIIKSYDIPQIICISCGIKYKKYVEK